MKIFFKNHEDSYLREAEEIEDLWGLFVGFVIKNLNQEFKKEIVNQE